MNDVINRLRDAATAVGDTVHDLPALRPARARARRPWLIPAVAAASVVAAVATGTVVFGGGARLAATGSAGTPEFFVRALSGELTVRREADGGVAARVPAPEGESFTDAAAAGDDRHFYLRTITTATGCGGHFYRLTVEGSSGGATLDRLAFSIPEGTRTTSLAASEDGGRLAYGLARCGPTDRAAGLVVADTATGQTRTWTGAGDPPVGRVAISGDGRYVAYQDLTPAPLATPVRPRPPEGSPAPTAGTPAPDAPPAPQDVPPTEAPAPTPVGRIETLPFRPELYLLDTSLPGADLGGSRKVTPAVGDARLPGGLQGFQLDADGGRIIAALGRVARTFQGDRAAVEPSATAIVRFDAVDGRLLDTVYQDGKGGMTLLDADGAYEHFLVRRGHEIASVSASGYRPLLTRDGYGYPAVAW
ncbi:hypothetical protein Skr01_29520 [Sphaerisporangium krabiense]|uniref:Uncharacterized protein n=1 Tax=Sphaerisporangium krabiense TaxID=763782 RepID=A0A7W8Z1Q9_9ACTN|nr:hypothetical protein [Sphaerisporangium krabiense]MBB5625796.1 hypothetical protein [Sphaerisporangium krabiense]GII62867.1 hypothetical protein Skr01_29520 [Sphaerisporangium krabiense]